MRVKNNGAPRRGMHRAGPGAASKRAGYSLPVNFGYSSVKYPR
jgi:hypothetical protein